MLYKLMPELLKRLLRIRVFHKIKYHEFDIVVVKRKIQIFKDKRILFQKTIDRGSRPLKQGLALIEDKLYYGDYWRNPEREDVYIYELDLNTGDKTIFYTFNWIRHIHFVQIDKYDNGYLIVGTGDSDEESGIYRIDRSTKELEVLGRGAQKHRAVSVIQTKQKLFYGSDNPDGFNYIYEYDKERKNVQPLYQIGGPAYYSTINKNGFFYIATTIEDRKRHRAIIYCSKDSGNSWHEYKEFKKDIWHTKYFGYGVVEFLESQKEFEKPEYLLIGLKEMV